MKIEVSNKISIIIPTYKRKNKLKFLLQSIERSLLYNLEVQVIIIIDGDDEDYSDLITRFNNFHFLHNDKEKLASRCRNMGALIAKNDILIFIDDDNILDELCIFHLWAILKNDNGVGLVGPLMLYANNPEMIWCAGGVIIKPFYKHKHIYINKNINQVNLINSRCDYIPNLYATRKDIFDRIGGFSSNEFPIALEEVDLAYKIKKLGYRIMITPLAKTYHDVPLQSDFHMTGIRSYYRGRSRVIFYKKYDLIRLLFMPIDLIIFSLVIIKNENNKMGEGILNYFIGAVDGLSGKDRLINE